MKETGVELLAPAGNFETALAAFEAGADAVYCVLSEFSARAVADNLTLEDLKNLLRYARGSRASRTYGRRVYVTFNTVIDENNVEAAIEQLALLDEARPDALIVQDIGVARVCRRHFPNLSLHASTQLVSHNLEGVLALKELGFTRVVLARELSLEEISSIARRCGDMELEVFVHGALCYSISGLCLFGAMEKGRSGNRGKCPYCCRQAFGSLYPFSMKDMRLGEDVRKLVDAGVASLKIEGRMKSALYVASVTKYYRQILSTESQSHRGWVTAGDLETVFSRRTTKLYFEGRAGTASARHQEGPVDSESLGHLGVEIGSVKRVTKDREGLSWLRFHTSRALERHDGLQFEAMTDEGRHLGMGVVEMRQAISRHPVFEVNAGTDVEILVNEDVAKALKPGMKIYCSMSNAVKRMFSTPSFRPSDYPGVCGIDLSVAIANDRVSATAVRDGVSLSASVKGTFESAKNPEKTREAVERAFSKLGGTDYRLVNVQVNDPESLFVPASVLNDLRRDLVEALDEARAKARRERIDRALADVVEPHGVVSRIQTVKIRAGQAVPPGEWDEIIVAISPATSQLLNFSTSQLRLSLPVYTAEPDFNRLRVTVKRLIREGFAKWEASDLATLRMLKQLGITDITADWTLYAFNGRALDQLAEAGVRRFVASPENNYENLQFLAESGYHVEFPIQQSTPLFISLTEPVAVPSDLVVFRRDGLWVTTRKSPRTFVVPKGVSTRVDLCWDPV